MKPKRTRRTLREWLAAEGRSQDWLAARVGVSGPYISMLLNRRRSPSLLVATRLEAVTGIPASELLARVA